MALNLTAALLAIIVFSCQTFVLEYDVLENGFTGLREKLSVDSTDRVEPVDTASLKLNVNFIPFKDTLLNYDLASFTAISFTAEQSSAITAINPSNSVGPNTSKLTLSASTTTTPSIFN